MKVNDTVPVTIAGQTVAQARVSETGDGQVTLIVPATLVVMATRTELAAPEPQAVDTTGTEMVITEVERTSAEAGSSAVVDVNSTQTGVVDTNARTPEGGTVQPAGEAGSTANNIESSTGSTSEGNSLQEAKPVEQVVSEAVKPPAQEVNHQQEVTSEATSD